jgi:hypothetical protein
VTAITTVLLLFTSLLTPAFGQVAATPASNPVLAKVMDGQIKQIKIGECAHGINPVLLYQQVEIDSAEDGEISIVGHSNDGSKWRATIEVAPVAECEVWAAELSPGYPPSIILLAAGIDSNGGWGTSLHLLLFNKDGMPMPWRATSMFDWDDSGVKEIVRVSGAERASVVLPIREGDRFDGFSYAYELYDVVGDRVQPVADVRYGVRWPWIPKGQLTLDEHRQMNSLSTVSTTTTAKGNDDSPVRIKKLSKTAANNDQIELDDSSAVLFPQMLVEDNAKHERVIVFAPQEEDLRKLLKPGTTVQLIGKEGYGDECAPLILRAVTR